MAAAPCCRSLRGVTTYRIVVDGELSDRFVATFEHMRLERDSGRTSLTGEIADQAQLHGLLARVADLGLSLVSFQPIEPGDALSTSGHHEPGPNLRLE
jgi:hypothetical protein